jgi:PAS domain-containing protein
MDPMARVNAARDILAAPPGIWTRSRTEEVLAPEDGLHRRATLPADGRHLDDAAVGVDRHHRDDTGIGEIYEVERTIGVHQDLPALIGQLFQLRRQALEIGRRQGEQKPVARPVLSLREPPVTEERPAMASRPLLQPDAAQNLALAMVECSEVPLLLLDSALTVIAASVSFCRAFQIDPASVAGRPIFELGAGEWDVPQLRSLLTVTSSGNAAVEAYEMDLERDRREPRRLVANARRLEIGDADGTRLLVTISDVTDARAAEKQKDDLLREKAILLQEVQHRVANSLR